MILLPAAFQKERKNNLVKTLSNVNWDIVDTILHGTMLQFVKLLFHLTTVGIRYLGGLQTHLAATLQVDKTVRSGIVGKIHLSLTVVSVKKYYLMMVMTKVTQSVEDTLCFVRANKGIGKKHHQRTAVQLLGSEVKCRGNRGCF